MKRVEYVLRSVDRIAIGITIGLWLSLVFAWSMPLVKSPSESLEVPMIHGENIYQLADNMPIVGKVITYSYLPLVWEVTPMSFHLAKNADGFYEPEEWSWILMLLTFVIGMGFVGFMIIYWQIGQPEKLKSLRIKTVIDLCFMFYMLLGVAGIYTFL